MKDLVIAEVLKPQGIRGEVKVKTFTDFPEDVKAFKTVYIDETPYKILSFRVGQDGAAFLGLAGVHDRDKAELLRGKLLLGKREDAPELGEGQYYVVDIIGLKCIDETGTVLGVVKDVTSIASEIYTLKTEQGKEILFPAVKGVVKRVDLEKGELVVDSKRFSEVAVY